MRVQLELADLQGVERSLTKALVKETNRIIKSSITDLENEIKELTRELMYNSAFFNDLLLGTLAGHFGIPENQISPTVKSIIDEIVNNIEVTYTNLSLSGSNVKGGVKIGIGKNGFISLLNLPLSSVTTKNGVELNWLEWVLTRGDQIIVSEHDIVFKVGAGRSGLAIMVPNRLANWRVPAEFSGTDTDNVITREIIRNASIYSRLISRLVNQRIKSKL